MKKEEHHEASLIAFIVTASGYSFLGVGAPFWGLILGGGVLMFQHLARKHQG